MYLLMKVISSSFDLKIERNGFIDQARKLKKMYSYIKKEKMNIILKWQIKENISKYYKI